MTSLNTFPRFIEDVCNNRRLQSALVYLSPQQFRINTSADWQNSSLITVRFGKWGEIGGTILGLRYIHSHQTAVCPKRQRVYTARLNFCARCAQPLEVPGDGKI